MALRLGPAFLVIFSFVAILLGLILHAISIDEIKFRSPPAKQFEPGVVIGDQYEDLVWFLQVTDLHLSNRGSPERIKDFEDFAKDYVNIVRPDVVLVTGDITDGRVPNTTFDTGPQEDEWIYYRKAVNKSIDFNKDVTTWLDIRGNHDNFNVYRPELPTTLYRIHSVQGSKHPRNYAYTLTKAGKNYTFIGVDEVQTPGLKIPFNFIGVVKDADLEELKKFKEEAKQRNSQFTTWFAHYPTSSIASPHEGIRNIVDGPYLCGHFHTIGNWVTKMHATQQPGFAEVELGDWKYNRRVRLAAIDHQLFSLMDAPFRQLPIALVTNPKSAEHAMPKFEPTGRIIDSTHIRAIAFSDTPITRVSLFIDGEFKGDMQKTAGSPLYTLPWTPKDYQNGLHKIEIHVEDSEGKKQTYSQGFSFDNSREEFSVGARILIRAYFKNSVMTIFYFMVTVCVLPLTVLRLIGYRCRDTSIQKHYKGTFLYNFHQLSNINRLYWPLVIVPIWVGIGPHFVGRLVDEAIGTCFVWGIIIDGTFIHTGITFNVGSIFLIFIHIPITVLLTYQVSDCRNSVRTKNTPAPIRNFKLILHLAITALQSWMGFILYSAYGLMSYLTSFLFLWSILIYAYCWYQCTTIEKRDLVLFNDSDCIEERVLRGHRTRDDKSSTSDHSTC